MIKMIKKEYYVTAVIQITITIPDNTPENVIEDKIYEETNAYLQRGDFDQTYDSLDVTRFDPAE
jgi:hypothetical protein